MLSEHAHAFDRLHPAVQRLLRQDLGWKRLCPVQQMATGAVLPANRDVLIIAGTAAGKTEAAWFPVFSSLLTCPAPGLGVLCVSPLKALIDDQVERLRRYGKGLDLMVDGWHGDISSARKNQVLQSPPNGLVITPESLQGLLLNRRGELSAVVQGLRYVVIDEVHAFAGTNRGLQLQALLVQLEELVGSRVPRLALSATVSDVVSMCDWIRPGDGARVCVVSPPSPRLALNLEVRGYDPKPPAHDRKDGKIGGLNDLMHPRDAAPANRLEIARDLDLVTR